ncbi:MAG: hypothetical protein L6277_02570, partial [Desulfobacterales bacterium]|nr:hypothetical protein [Desulfobacterales bacterium]
QCSTPFGIKDQFTPIVINENYRHPGKALFMVISAETIKAHGVSGPWFISPLISLTFCQSSIDFGLSWSNNLKSFDYLAFPVVSLLLCTDA